MKKLSLNTGTDLQTETIVELARCSKLDRIILAGSRAPERMFELHRHGYLRVATTSACGLPRGQYDVALVEWQLPSIKALATTLDWLVHFMAPDGVLVIALNTRECPDRGRLRPLLRKLGFRVQAGTRCENGIAISARRADVVQEAVAA
jgi:hypothetical protein